MCISMQDVPLQQRTACPCEAEVLSLFLIQEHRRQRRNLKDVLAPAHLTTTPSPWWTHTGDVVLSTLPQAWRGHRSTELLSPLSHASLWPLLLDSPEALLKHYQISGALFSAPAPKQLACHSKWWRMKKAGYICDQGSIVLLPLTPHGTIPLIKWCLDSTLKLQ